MFQDGYCTTNQYLYEYVLAPTSAISRARPPGRTSSPRGRRRRRFWPGADDGRADDVGGERPAGKSWEIMVSSGGFGRIFFGIFQEET